MSFVATTEQAAIIGFPPRPLRVAAGAGTGKTTTLAHRVASLVDDHDLRPDQILGITFTNKAAHELAQSIRSVLADRLEPGEAVDVATYHGFAAQILQDHGIRVGVERTASVITPTFARQILLDAVTAGTYELLDITSHRKVIGDLVKLSSDLGDNLLTPSALLDQMEGPADDVVAARAEYAAILGRYDAAKRHLDALDYADLIRLAHRLVTQHPLVGDQIRARYRAVLLDEYQDTNPAQRMLLQALFGGGFPVTAVGDRDQTIYEWRGASLENFARFGRHFPDSDGTPAADLGLTLNRRSGGTILEIANRVRGEVSGPTAEPLRPLPEADPGTVEGSWYRTSRIEADAIAQEMRRLHEEEGVAWKEMAVLFRKNKDIATVRDTLDDHGIPIQVANLGGLLGIPEVVEVHAWLRILAEPEDGPALARILMGSRHRLGMGEMRRIADWVRARSDQSQEDDPEHLPDHTLMEALDHLDELAVEVDTRRTLDQFVVTYRRLLTVAQGASLVELVRRILSETDAWRDVQAMPSAAQLSARLNLYRFLDLAEEWSPLEGRPSLTGFLAYLNLMQEEDIEELDTARISDDDAVTLLTVHRSKGLEWDTVFIPAVHHNNFPSQVRIYEDPFEKAAILPNEYRLDAEDRPHLTADMEEKERRGLLRERHQDQEWRLAYVAVTRAKRRLYVSGAIWTGVPSPAVRPKKPSSLLDLLHDHPAVDTGTWVDDPGERPESLRLESMRDSPDPLFAEGWDEGLRRVIDDPAWARSRAREGELEAAYDAQMAEYRDMLFSLPEPVEAVTEPEPLRTSVTGLVTYATCPKRYYWSEVDRLPRRASAAARRGVELHRRIEMHNRGAVPFDELEGGLYDVTPAESEGAEVVESAYERFLDSRFAHPAPTYIEAPFDLRLGDDARLRGRIDAIYVHDDTHWEVVDFKSGRPSRNPATTVQLQAYAIAAREAGFGPRPPEHLDVTFVYFGGGLEERTERVDDEWIQRAVEHLTDLLTAIRNEEYEATPSPACRNCDFERFCPAGREWLAGQD